LLGVFLNLKKIYDAGIIVIGEILMTLSKLNVRRTKT